MTEINQNGGARVGFAHASWPFARLIVTSDKLELSASILGEFIFKPSDVTSIEVYSGISLFPGIKINHNVEAYNQNIVFITRSSARELINQIVQTGFLNNRLSAPAFLDQEITNRQAAGGFPLKISAVIAIVVIWNLLCLHDFIPIFEKQTAVVFGPGI